MPESTTGIDSTVHSCDSGSLADEHDGDIRQCSWNVAWRTWLCRDWSLPTATLPPTKFAHRDADEQGGWGIKRLMSASLTTAMRSVVICLPCSGHPHPPLCSLPLELPGGNALALPAIPALVPQMNRRYFERAYRQTHVPRNNSDSLTFNDQGQASRAAGCRVQRL